MVLYEAVDMEFTSPIGEKKVMEIAGRLRYILIELQRRIGHTCDNIRKLQFMDKTGQTEFLIGKLTLISMNLDKVVFLERTSKNALRFSWPQTDMSVMPATILGSKVALKKVLDSTDMKRTMRDLLTEASFKPEEYKLSASTYEREVKVD